MPIIVFTDGAAKGNPGPGGWGAIVVTPDQHVTELGGGSPHTTNNRMELSGAIAALQHVANQPGPVAIYTDSTYVIQGITQWVWGWRKRGWKTAQGGDVLNRESVGAAVEPHRRARPRRRELALGARPHRDPGQRARRSDFRGVRAAGTSRTCMSGRSTATRCRFSSCRTTRLCRSELPARRRPRRPKPPPTRT